MNIAIIGSREFSNKAFFDKTMLYELSALGKVNIISGGARGVDTWVSDYCKEHDVAIEVIRPINPANKQHYLYRNIEIITKADLIIAFWDGVSTGTKFVLGYATERGKEMKVFLDENNKE